MDNDKILFDRVFSKIRSHGVLQTPPTGRMDNWAVGRWVLGNLEATLSDGGYCRSILKKTNNTLAWRVNDFYPAPIEYIGITSSIFESETRCDE